jgi:hypothetical protein
MSIAFCDCRGCGHIDEFKIDGYPFGDRLLEGVMFTIDKYGKARIQEEDKAYFKRLNEKHWCELAEEHATEADVVQCVKCDCDIYFDEAPKFETKEEK